MADLEDRTTRAGPEPTLPGHYATKGYSDTTRHRAVANARSGSFTLAVGDVGAVDEVNSTAAATVTIPLNSAQPFPIGTRRWVCRYGTGTVAFAVAAGVTLRNPGLTFDAQYATLCLRKRGTDEWLVERG